MTSGSATPTITFDVRPAAALYHTNQLDAQAATRPVGDED
jgi:hypothetical protein